MDRAAGGLPAAARTGAATKLPRGGASGRTRPPTPWLEQVQPGRLPTLERLPAHVEVAVAGGGVIGMALAYGLARRGARVLVLESRLPGWGASGRNAGLVLGGPASLRELRAVLDEEEIDAGYGEPGHLALASSPEVMERFRAELAARPAGAAPLQVLDRGACEALLGLRIAPRFQGGRWMPVAGSLHPARFLYGLAGAAVRRGARVAARTPVRAVRPAARGAGWEVRTVRGTVRAERVVLACNAFAARLWPALRPVLTPSRGQVLATRPLPRVFGPGMAVDYGAVYWRQAPDGSVVIGGCRDADPGPERNARPGLNPRIQRTLQAFLPDAFPGLSGIQVARRWSGIMDATPDGRPLAGPWPDTPELWVAAGFGGHGLPPALGVGRALAEAMLEGTRPAELAPLDPARFGEVLAC